MQDLLLIDCAIVNIMKQCRDLLVSMYTKGKELADVTVSYDGSWNLRGHCSNFGIGAIIDNKQYGRNGNDSHIQLSIISYTFFSSSSEWFNFRRIFSHSTL